MTDQPVLRVARPTDRLVELKKMYLEGLGLIELGSFADHQGFDGVMLGHPKAPYHLEFTTHRDHPAAGPPSPDNLLIFYLADGEAWLQRCRKMLDAGFKQVPSFNPYWDQQGQTFEDLDGYRVVIQNATWDA